MNATVYTIFREYLDKTQQDPAAAASLTLAHICKPPLTPRVQRPGRRRRSGRAAHDRAEAARWLRIAPGKVLQWIHGGELPATNIATRRRAGPATASPRRTWPPSRATAPPRLRQLTPREGQHVGGLRRRSRRPATAKREPLPDRLGHA